MRLDVKIDTEKIMARLSANAGAATSAVSAQVLKDSNYYVPLKTSVLMKSGIIHSDLSRAEVKWDALPHDRNGNVTHGTSYAAAQYYGEKFDHSKQNNPNATHHWFERAKEEKLPEWEKLAQSFFK